MDNEEVVSLATIANLAPDDALQAIAQLVDYAHDQGDLALTTKALDWCDEIESRLTSESQRIHLDYFRANAWAQRQSTRHADRSAAWAWDQEELQQQVFFLLRARNSPAFDQLPALRRCQVLTNLANQFDTVGHFIEARMLWSDALTAQPEFWMARANRGRGLMHYAHALDDPGHTAVFALEAHKDLVQALRHIDEHPEYGDPGLRAFFSEATRAIEGHFDLQRIAADYGPDQFELGDGEDERRYRKWCLRETLFLNPLNDLGPIAIAARDVLTLPDFVTPIGEPPALVGLFNQLKQEFVSARWLYSEGTFTYGKRYLERPEVVALDPFHLPLSTRPRKFTKLKGIPGAVRDASPDAWGRRVIQARLQRPEADIQDVATCSTDRTMAPAT